jgi:hypothetical protein
MKFHLPLAAALAAAPFAVSAAPASTDDVKPTEDAAALFHRNIEPLLVDYCYGCHGDGVSKGQVAFDGFETSEALIADTRLWMAVLKNVRSGVMPPADEGYSPNAEQVKTLEDWIKYRAFGIDPAQPDPGRVTLRRLNRLEYRNTIRDLMGIDFNSEVEFPPDDTGHGFDNIADVLTLSPLMMEKYLQAAETIVDTAVPKVGLILPERIARGRDFQSEDGRHDGDNMNVRTPARVSTTFNVAHSDTYQLKLNLEIRGSFDFDPGRARVIFSVDGIERFREEVVWQERKRREYEFNEQWTAGDHVLTFEVEPLPPLERYAGDTPPPPRTTPPPEERPPAPRRPPPANIPASILIPPSNNANPAPQTRVVVNILSAQVIGPKDPARWEPPENHARFFPEGPAPADPQARDAYARRVLERFATRAFRRPVEEARVTALVALARDVYTQKGATFEEGVGRAMMAVLGSPRFLFRIEEAAPLRPPEAHPFIDEYALASRLSYFLWSTMPDEELFALAGRGALRANLAAQVGRMLADPKSETFIRNFVGQWLQARDIEFVPINAHAVLGLPRVRGGPRVEFGQDLRKAMRSETEMYFAHVVREDRSVLELLDSDYTFLNEKLASHYGVPGVEGDRLRRVTLPQGSPHGGVLTHASILAVTSNPTRTSPVKRGHFILENILGTPPPPAPPDVPTLEEALDAFEGREPTLKEMLALHASNGLCHSCHARMDPLGLALENFDAMGLWRDTEAGQPIEPAGKLITGETFADIRELKRILVNERRVDFYRCLTEKLMTYALGRGVEPADVHTIDRIVAQLEAEKGRFSALLLGIIESVPFQKQRAPLAAVTTSASAPRLSASTPEQP